MTEKSTIRGSGFFSEPSIRHVYCPYHYCNVCKAREPMPTYTAGYRTANLHSHRSFVLQLSPKMISQNGLRKDGGPVRGHNVPWRGLLASRAMHDTWARRPHTHAA